MRCVFYPDYDAEITIELAANLRAGESSMVIPYSDLPEHPIWPRHHSENIRAYMHAKIGPPTHNGNCVLVPKGARATPDEPYVILTEHAGRIGEPYIDSWEGYDAIWHPDAGAGWRFDGQKLTPPER